MENQSLINWWVIHNQFMGLGNLFKVAMHYFLIRMITCLKPWDEFLMMSALVYMIIYWTWFIMNRDISYWVVMISQSYYVAWTFNLERILNESWDLQ